MPIQFNVRTSVFVQLSDGSDVDGFPICVDQIFSIYMPLCLFSGKKHI